MSHLLKNKLINCIVSRQILEQAQDEVSLSVAGLASGLYAYQVLVDGAVRATGRVMVAH